MSGVVNGVKVSRELERAEACGRDVRDLLALVGC